MGTNHARLTSWIEARSNMDWIARMVCSYLIRVCRVTGTKTDVIHPHEGSAKPCRPLGHNRRHARSRVRMPASAYGKVHDAWSSAARKT